MALRICACPTCFNTSRTNTSLLWFPLPKPGFLRDQWMDILGIKDSSISESTRVCSFHFKAKDISKNKILKTDAVPSVHLGKKGEAHFINDDDIELSDDEVKVVEEKKKEEPSPAAATPEGRPSRRAARMAAEKIQNTVRKYGLNDESPPPSPKKVELNYNPVFEKSSHMVKQPFDVYGQKKIQPVLAPRSQMQVINLPLNKIQTTSSGQQISLKVAIPQPQRATPITTRNQITYSVKASTAIAKQSQSNPTTTVILKPLSGTSKTISQSQQHIHKIIASSKTTSIKPQITIAKPQMTITKPQIVTPKPQIGIAPKQNNYMARPKDDTMNLVMECVEISLSPSQLKAQHNAVKAYEEFERKMKAYKTAKDTRIIYCTTNEVPPLNTSSYTNSLISTTSPAMPQGSNTGKPPEKPAVAKAVRAPVLQPGMVITQTPQGMQLIRGVVPQQSLVLANTTNTVTQGTNSQISYKVLVDSRTGLVVGTIPNDSPLLQTTNANNQQTLTIQPSKPQVQAAPITTNSSGLTITGVQGNVNTTDNSYNKLISGGNKTVVAQSLLSIKVLPGQDLNKDSKNSQITHLGQILDKDKFLSAPILWLSKVGLVDKEIKCLCMKDRMELSACKFSVDGYLWRCKKAPKCQRTVQIPRISFFARFGAQLYKLHRLIFHWSVQSDILHVIHDTVVDIYMVRSVWRAIQEICGKALDNKSVKLGGPGSKVEVATIKMGWHIVIGAYDRGTGLSRMKVVTENKGQPFGITSIMLKNLEQWVMPHSTVITTDYRLSTINRNSITYKYINMNVPYNSDLTVKNAIESMETQLVRMFGSFSMVQLKPETIQGFLDEYQWRVRYGKTPRTTFWNIISDIANQSGRKIIIPKEIDMSVTTASSSSSDDDVILDESGKVQVKNLLKHAGTWSHQPKIIRPTPKPTAPPEPPKLVDLNNYYYARKNPDAYLSSLDPNLNSYRFKCLVCRKILDNNIKVMKHLMAHLEQTRQRNPDLSDLTQCKYCFRDFETPYSMQCHMENVHLSTNNLACKICNHALSSKTSLINHMKHHHVQSEIPYCCSTCNFRSSFHREVIDHFQQNHNGTNKLLCHYCLKTYNIKFNSVNAVGMIQNYYYHLYKHQIKSANKKCSNCCLVFVNVIELKTHRQKDHLSMAKKKDVFPLPINTQHPILVPEPTKKPKGAKSPPHTGPRRSKAPIPGPPILEPYIPQPVIKQTETEELSPVFISDNNDLENQICVECKQPIERAHFSKKMCCGKCRYTSNCGKAFVEHMIAQHSNIVKAKKDMHFMAEPIELANPLHCICGFKSVHCNIIANHMLKCGYKTCYPSAVAALAATVKIEPEDIPCDKGSAFFPPLVVLDENEEEFVNKTLSKIPKPAEEKQSLHGKRKRIEGEGGSDAEKPSIMNALGLVRRKSSHSDDETDPPLLTREDLDEKPRKGPARNTRSSRTAKRARTAEKEMDDEKDISRETDLEAPPSLETVAD